MSVHRFFFGLYAGTGVISLTALIGALIFSSDFTVPAGVLFGSILGIAPFASWHLIATLTDGFRRKDRIPLAAGIGLGKYALLGALGWLLFRWNWVHPWALLGGLTIVLPVLVIAGFRPPDGELKKKDVSDGPGPAGT
jgi:hypothetical protein